MKPLALFMAVCILFLSSFSGMVNSVIPNAKKGCCHKMAVMQSCKHQKKQAPKDCNGMSCTMMFSCSLCGFLVVEPVSVEPGLFFNVEKPVTPYKMGNLSDYHNPGWQPPKV
jgi:hypothetical protein